MGIGIGIFLIAAGAVVSAAAETTAQGLDADAMGTLLMILGVLALLMTMVLWDDWTPAATDQRADGPAPGRAPGRTYR